MEADMIITCIPKELRCIESLAPKTNWVIKKDYSIYSDVLQDPIRYIEYLQEEHIRDSTRLVKVAQTLPGRSVDEICRHVFKKQGISTDFVKVFYKYFIPSYVKRKYNWYALSLLVRASVAYPEHFDLIVEDLLQDKNTPSDILIDFADTLDAKKKTNMMNVVTKVNMDEGQYCKNLQFICCLLTDCERPDDFDEYLSTYQTIFL